MTWDRKRARDVQSIFGAVASNYDLPAQVFGLFQYRSWHQTLVARIVADQPTKVLDMCTGTGAIAARVASQTTANVVGADLTLAMLDRAKRFKGDGAGKISLVRADAQAPPFRDGSFDVVLFSFLLRYVKDVPATIRALGRLVRPGGLMAGLEFGMPTNRLTRAAWRAYARILLPIGLTMVSPGWGRIGRFLGKSIEDFNRQWPASRLERCWLDAGFDMEPTRLLSLGGATMMCGTRCL